MTTALFPQPKAQFFDTNGIPLVGGKIYTYAAGTTTPQATYTNSTGLTQNTNPVILDSRGEANIWLTNTLFYYIELRDSLNNLIWNVDNVSNQSGIGAISISSGSASVGYIGQATTAVSSNVQSKLRENISVKDFGAKGDGITDDTVAIQLALTYLLTTGRGGKLYFPAGTYLISSSINIYPKTFIYGDGRETTVILSAHLGDCFVTSSPINSSVDMTVVIKDIGMRNTNASNIGAGYNDVGGTFIHVENVKIVGFTYGVILDQSELVRINNCDFESQIAGGSSMWLVNGPDHSFTTSLLGTSTGSQIINPTSMALITACYNLNGANTYLYVENADYSNGEVVHVTAITASTFTATFSTTKSNNFRIGARPGFTNQIDITGCQFNNGSSTKHIIDDGGGSHYISGNNFNGASIGIAASNVVSLSIINNEFEQANSYNLLLINKTGGSGNNRLVGSCSAFSIIDNTFGGGTASIYLSNAESGEIKNNTFFQYSIAGISFDNPSHAIDVEISGNKIVTYGQGITNLPLFIPSQLSIAKQQGIINQKAQTYVVSALVSTGSQVITPAYMQLITEGNMLTCQNIDGTNIEQVVVTSVGASTFVATFASTKTAGWLVSGVSGIGCNDLVYTKGVSFPALQVLSADQNTLDDYEEGTWTGLFSSDGGTITTDATLRTGKYVKIGKQVTVTGYFKIASVSSPTGDLYITGLPFVVENSNASSGAGSIKGLSFAATATTSLVGGGGINTSYIIINKYSAGTIASMATDAVANAIILLTLTYFTN